MSQIYWLSSLHLRWSFLISATAIVHRSEIPKPIVVPTVAGTLDSSHGSGYTFAISVGTPPQPQEMLISTSKSQTFPQMQGCPMRTTSPQCIATGTGRQFGRDNSSTWINITTGEYDLPMDEIVDLGYLGIADKGLDVISFNGDFSLKNQTIGILAHDSESLGNLGVLGINPKATIISGQPPIPSYLQSLRSQYLIPSLSWGYTAGNPYRDTQAFGHLTLGGYDSSKFATHDLFWHITAMENSLAVQLNSISTILEAPDNPKELLPTAITIRLDSTLPYMWLPKDAYTLFEVAFGLIWDDAAQLYVVNDTLHASLIAKNPSIIFNLGSNGFSGTVNITLPYAAFDLTRQVPETSRYVDYFPLKRAANETQYVLGRFFFQEAYVVVDYERGNFSVFPCKWEQNSQPQIVSILSPEYGNITNDEEHPDPLNSNSSDTNSRNKNSTSNSSATHSKTSLIAGGTVGGVAVLTIIIAALVFILYWNPARLRRKRVLNEPSPLEAFHRPLSSLGAFHKPELEDTEKKLEELEGAAISEIPANERSVYELPAPITVSELCALDSNTHD